MTFLQINILASDREEIVSTLERLKKEIQETPSLEFFALAVLDERRQFEAVSEEVNAHDIWELRR